MVPHGAGVENKFSVFLLPSPAHTTIPYPVLLLRGMNLHHAVFLLRVLSQPVIAFPTLNFVFAVCVAHHFAIAE